MADKFAGRGRSADAERLLYLLMQNPDADIRNEARFRQGLRLAQLSRYREAALLFRRVVDERPGAAPARLQLAAMLQMLGDAESAGRELRTLRTIDLPATVARFVDRLSAALQSNKPFGFQFEIALAPDSNVNRATSLDTLGTVFGDFAINEESKASSGVGAALRGTAHARRPISDGVMLQARMSVDASIYKDKRFNDISVDLASGPEFRLGSTRIGLEVGAAQQWYGMRPYQRGARLAVSASRPIDSVSVARADLSARVTDNRMNDLQDGRGYSARLRYERALSSELIVSASFGGDRFQARDAAYSTKSWQAGVAAQRNIGRMTVTAGIDVGGLVADDRLALLPKARSDRLRRFQIGLINRRLTIAGFAPITKLVIERNRSTVEFYDFKRTRMEFGVTRAF